MFNAVHSYISWGLNFVVGPGHNNLPHKNFYDYGNTSDERHDTSDVASIIAKAGVFAGLPLSALSLILPLPTAEVWVWSVQLSCCDAQRKLVG